MQLRELDRLRCDVRFAGLRASEGGSFAQLGAAERPESDHLRHSKFIGLREDKDPRSVVKEHGGEV